MSLNNLFVQGYFKALRTEKLSSKISVTLLCPGPVTSNILPQCFTDKVDQVRFF